MRPIRLTVAVLSLLAFGVPTPGQLSFPSVRTFGDVAFTDRWYGTTDLLRERNITVGCQGSPVAIYCPDFQPDRAMVSILVIRSIYSGLYGDPEAFGTPPGQYFTDVPPSHWAFRYIQQMKYLGITTGCAENLYCPEAPTANFMLAIFTVRARWVRDNYGAIVPAGWIPPHSTWPQRFNDIPYGHVWFPWVQRAYELVGPETYIPADGGFFYPDSSTRRGQASFYLIYGILGSQGLPPNYQPGAVAFWIPSVVNGPNCGLTAGPFYTNEVYQVTADSYYSYSGTVIVPGDVTLWVSGLRTSLNRSGTTVFDSNEVQGQNSATYRYPASGNATLVAGNYLQTSYHRAASGACNTVIPSAAIQTSYWPANGQPTYLPVLYYLATAVSPTGGGTISPPSGWYNSGQVVTVTATPNTGYQFAGFTGALSGTTNPQNLTMNGTKSVTATFSPTQYQITTGVSPTGGGTITPNCASGCLYNAGQVVTITASPSPGYVLAGYSGSLTGTANPQSLTMNGPASVTANFSDTLTSTNLTDLQSCIGSMGLVKNCVLVPSRYAVNTPLRIQRSGINVMGGGGPGDTTLYRNSANLVQIIVADANVSDVSIKNLTFDGNRYGPGLGLSCLPGNAEFYDLDLRSGGKFTVQWTNFINAPGWALIFNGKGSSVSLSNFGQGGYGYAPDGQLRNLTGPESATRSTAIWIECDSNCAGTPADPGGNGAWYNAISYAGTAAINLLGSHQYAYGNLLYQNRYEISDGSQGGQVFLDPGSSAAHVAGNVIDGNNWPEYTGNPPQRPSLATGCQLPLSPQFNAGVEAYGWDHYFFNNEIERHTGSGMQFAGSQPTGRITISSENPSDPSDTPRYVEMNKAGGIVFLGPIWSSWPVAAQGVALYKINARNNAIFDVVLDSLSNDSTPGYYGVGYYGFVGESCIIPGIPNPPNYYGPVAGVPGVNGGLPPPHPNTLLYPVPTSYGAYPPNGTCPDPGWPAQTPARSNIPGWRW